MNDFTTLFSVAPFETLLQEVNTDISNTTDYVNLLENDLDQPTNFMSEVMETHLKLSEIQLKSMHEKRDLLDDFINTHKSNDSIDSNQSDDLPF